MTKFYAKTWKRGDIFEIPCITNFRKKIVLLERLTYQGKLCYLTVAIICGVPM